MGEQDLQHSLMVAQFLEKHYASMMGKTIDAVTYYTENGVVKYDIDDTYVPYKFDTSAFKIQNADVTSWKCKSNCANITRSV